MNAEFCPCSPDLITVQGFKSFDKANSSMSFAGHRHDLCCIFTDKSTQGHSELTLSTEVTERSETIFYNILLVYILFFGLSEAYIALLICIFKIVCF